jgi:hypothetical protein
VIIYEIKKKDNFNKIKANGININLKFIGEKIWLEKKSSAI